MNQSEGAQKLRDFTSASLSWCSKEAENGTERVMSAIDVLLKDIKRVSAMSGDSLKALNSLQGILKNVDHDNYAHLRKSLETLSKENHEIDSYIQPIMEALQFQDRFRQNVENIVHMIDIWHKFRARPDLSTSDSKAMMTEFGQALVLKTTMSRERDIIRAHIDGLEAEKEVQRVELF
ncbi:MAG: hypothetical protein V4655_00785 [Bdellovibrionota bacterium]